MVYCKVTQPIDTCAPVALCCSLNAPSPLIADSLVGACSYNKTVLKSFPYPITCTTLQVRGCWQAVLHSMHSPCLLILMMNVKEQVDARKRQDTS